MKEPWLEATLEDALLVGDFMPHRAKPPPARWRQKGPGEFTLEVEDLLASVTCLGTGNWLAAVYRGDQRLFSSQGSGTITTRALAQRVAETILGANRS